MTCLPRFLLSLMAALALPVSAHEFWLWPQTFLPQTGEQVRLTMYVGENFEGSQAGFTSSHAKTIRHYQHRIPQDLDKGLSDTTILPDLPVTVKNAGNHVIAYDSHPSTVILDADKFHAYLQQEGLGAIIRQREQDGSADSPGRERYRRHAKTLLQVGGRSSQTYAVRTGQRLEILPLANPYQLTVGKSLPVKLVFEGKPLAGALIKAWHKRAGETVVLQARTSKDGQASFVLPYSGPWMISTVHMIKASDLDEIEWDSFWGNLTFYLPQVKK